MNTALFVVQIALYIFLSQTSMPGSEDKLPEGPLIWHGHHAEVSFLHRDFQKLDRDAYRSNRSGLQVGFFEIEAAEGDAGVPDLKAVTTALAETLTGESGLLIKLGEQPKRKDQPRAVRIFLPRSGSGEPDYIGFVDFRRLDRRNNLVMLFLMRGPSFSEGATGEMNFCLSAVTVG